MPGYRPAARLTLPALTQMRLGLAPVLRQLAPALQGRLRAWNFYAIALSAKATFSYTEFISTGAHSVAPA